MAMMRRRRSAAPEGAESGKDSAAMLMVFSRQSRKQKASHARASGHIGWPPAAVRNILFYKQQPSAMFPPTEAPRRRRTTGRAVGFTVYPAGNAPAVRDAAGAHHAALAQRGGDPRL